MTRAVYMTVECTLTPSMAPRAPRSDKCLAGGPQRVTPDRRALYLLACLVSASLVAGCSAGDRLPTSSTSPPAAPTTLVVTTLVVTTLVPMAVADPPEAVGEDAEAPTDTAAGTTGLDGDGPAVSGGGASGDVHTTREAAPQDDLHKQGGGADPIQALPLPGSERPHLDPRFDPGEIRTYVSGSIEPLGRKTYVLEAAAGFLFRAEIEAPPGVWLDVRLGDDVIASSTARSQRVEASLPAGGAWLVSAVSTHEESADYRLTVEVLSPGSEPPVTSTTVAGPVAAPDRPVVYLTFDDGPHPTQTPEVLDILGRYGARATFFVVGYLVEAYPELMRRITVEGHTVANHTWGHENLTGLSRASFDRTISRTQEALGDQATPCLRPPYGATNSSIREWAGDHGLEVIMWTVSANDWLGLAAEAIADRIVGGVTDGSIVLMHDGGGNRSETLRGLEMVLDRLSDKDLRFEPVCRRPEGRGSPGLSWLTDPRDLELAWSHDSLSSRRPL